MVSALSVHHLTHGDKRELFEKVHDSLAGGGYFFNADQVSGETPETRTLAAAVTSWAEAEEVSLKTVTAANAMNGTEGCATWLDAESKLVAAADIVPFANNQVKTFGNGAEFDYPGTFMPTSIRMVAK